MVRGHRTGGAAVLVALVCCLRLVAHPGDGLILAPDGSVYFGGVHPFADGGHHACTWRIDPAGKVTPFFRSDHDPSNIWLALGKNGLLYAAERRYLGDASGEDEFVTDLWRFDAAGNKTHILGPTAGRSPFGEAAFLIDEAGDLIHAQGNRLVRRSLAGKVQTIAGGSRGSRDGPGAEARFQRIAKLAWGPNRQIYVLEPDAVRVVAPDATVRTLATGLKRPGEPTSVLRGGSILFDLAVNQAGDAHVANWGKRLVLRISAAGKTEILFRTEAPWSPEGIALRDDELYVYESQEPGGLRPRIRKRAADGRLTLVHLPSD